VFPGVDAHFRTSGTFGDEHVFTILLCTGRITRTPFRQDWKLVTQVTVPHFDCQPGLLVQLASGRLQRCFTILQRTGHRLPEVRWLAALQQQDFTACRADNNQNRLGALENYGTHLVWTCRAPFQQPDTLTEAAAVVLQG